MSAALTIAFDLILPQIIKALKRDDVPVSNSQATQIAERVAQQVAPVIVNQANQEPWYQSRVILGSIVAILGGVLQLYGYSFSAEDQAMVVDVIGQGITFAGTLFALYGRLVAKKPLGQ
jgi:hypothetical protein